VKKNIKNLSMEQLKEELTALGLEGYRAQQIKKWLYQKDVTSFDQMTNLGKDYKALLKEHFEIPQLSIKDVQQSSDGTRKYLIELADGKSIETVMIPTEDRNTLCISTQVGCAMGCHFCYTATMGLMRNLTIFEILEQVSVVRRDWGQNKPVTNLVFMGMGEPLVNTKNLYSSLDILIDPECYALSRHHITVSTSGIATEIEKFGDRTPVKLAVSLHATTNEQRDSIMPINKKFPLDRLMDSLGKMNLPKRNRITFEYILLHGVNDSMDDARRLAKLLRNLPSKINLILFNEFPGSPFKRPPDEWAYKFQKILLDAGYVAVIRKSRGRDILGACGQLAITKEVQGVVIPDTVEA